jgi:putative drug exporter of the RND superfamily
MSAIARWCFRHRYVVIVGWLALLVGLAGLNQAVKSTYNNSFSLPGTGSTTAQQLLAKALPAQAGDQDTIVWHVSNGSVRDASVVSRMSRTLRQVSAIPEVAAVASPYGSHGGAQISKDGTTAYATVDFGKQADSLDKADIQRVINTAEAARAPGLDVQLGGQAIGSTEQAALSTSSTVGVLAAAVVLFIAFGSLLAMTLPLITAIAGVGGGILAIAPLTHVMSVVNFASILGTLIGLGVGIDYALFIVTRHRRGIQSGLTPEEAAVQAVNTSGRAVLFAGSTVCIALLGILVLGVSFLNGLAVASALTVVFTVLAAVTLLPALLGVYGMRVLSRRQRRKLVSSAGALTGAAPAGVWARWAGYVQRRPGWLAIAGTAVILLCAVPVLHLRLGASDQGNDPSSTTTRQAYNLLADGFGPGFNGPLLLVAQTSGAGDTAALNGLVAELPRLADVASAHVVAGVPGTEVIQVTPRTSPEAKATSDLIGTLRTTTIPAAEHGTTLRVYVGGVTATFADFAGVVGAKLPWFLLAIIGLSFLLLIVAFRSLLIPATAAVMNLIAAASAFGVLTAFFEWGWGTSAFGLGNAGPIEAFLPVVTLAILFGLSMDYQVFLVSRMSEEWLRVRHNGTAVRTGQVETARVITAAATIMICVFGTFSLMGQRDVAEFGIGLAAAVALDAFILRTVLVPSLMHLFGKANWWLPRWLDKRLPHLAIEPPEAATEPQIPVRVG